MNISHKVTITKLDHAGKRVLSYPGQIVYCDEKVIVARCAWTHSNSYDLGPFSLEQGDIFVEFYYLKEWFNIFAIYDTSGVLKGWYCNVTEPLEIAGDEIRWQDLALDLLILPDGKQIPLDEKEFEDLNPSAATRARAEGALSTLRVWLDEERPPFVLR